jgi:predicted transcriptional regulator
LREVYIKKPENVIIHQLIKKEQIEAYELRKFLGFDKKTFTNAVKNLIKEKKVIKIKHTCALNPNWEISLSLLAIGTIKY